MVHESVLMYLFAFPANTNIEAIFIPWQCILYFLNKIGPIFYE